MKASICAGLLLASASVLAGEDLPPSPAARPVSEAERAAVGMALDYLALGPEGLKKHLAPDSTFSRLPAAEALAEIEVRAGPAAGAKWELRTTAGDLADHLAVFGIEYPSGLATGLVLNLRLGGGVWKIRGLRTLAEEASAADSEHSVISSAPARPAEPGERQRIAACLLACLALAGVMAAPRKRLPIRRLLLAGGAVVVAAVAVVAVFLVSKKPAPQAKPPSPSAPAAVTPARLAPLLEARRALAISDTRSARDALARVPAEGKAEEVARIWRMELAMHEHDIAEARKILASFPAPSRIPQVEVLRGRVEFYRNRPDECSRAYDEAIRLGPLQDGLQWEAAQLLYLLGSEDFADHYVLRLAHSGTRLAEPYYARAIYWIRQEKGLDAEKWFQEGWRLRPFERADLFSLGVFWDLLRRASLYALVQLDSPDEPTVQWPDTSARALPLPSGVEAGLCGGYLRFKLPNGQLSVPGGWHIAPAGTRVEDAGAWTRAEEDEALRSLPQLTLLAGPGGAIAEPLLRRRIDHAATALAKRARWDDLIRLTDSFDAAVELVPSDLLLLRVEALRRQDRLSDARGLLERMVASETIMRRSEAGTLFDLAREFFILDDNDRAITFAKKASAKLHAPVGDPVVWRAEMQKRLAESSKSYQSAHFLIRYPRAHPEAGTQKLGQILEWERTRLARWVPLQSRSMTEVQLLWFREFRRAYQDMGLDVIGVFDGKIRLPLAGGQSLDLSDPAIVALVTHELTHAMISEATKGAAPHWFQEGLAQHLEMGPERFNPVPLYQKQKRLLSLPVVEGVLAGLPEPDLTEIAYEEARWMVLFLEQRFGPAGIQHLLSAFREGATTEEALAKLKFRSVSDFESQFRTWCSEPASRSWSRPIVYYFGRTPASVTPGLPKSLSDRRVPW